MRPRFCIVNVEDRYSLDRDLKFPVPQGSLCGPVLHSAYALTPQVVVPSPPDINSFADDHSLKDSFKASNREDKLHTIKESRKLYQGC